MDTLTDDVPLIGFDFSVLAAWFFYPEIISAVGQTTAIVAGLGGIYLTYLKIVRERKLIKQIDNPPAAKDVD